MPTQDAEQDAPSGEGAMPAYPWARAIFRLEDRVDQMAPVVASVPQIQEHLTRQDRDFERLNAKVDNSLSAMHTKMDAGFGGIRSTLDAMATPFGHAQVLLDRDLQRRRRKIALRSLVDRSVDKLQYGVGVLWMGISVFAFTHPVGGRPDPDVLAGWAAVTALGVLAVARTAYVALHREQDDPDDPGDDDPTTEHHQQHHQQAQPQHHQGGQR